MFTLGFRFKPWRSAKAIADGPSILAYLQEAATENGIDKHMRFNHKVVAATIPEHEGRVLLTRRTIQPARGKWTFPGGFVDWGEPVEEGALRETWELIVDPFYDRGGLDKGLFWHLSASLQRVALGYALATMAGVALGTLVGQSTWAMRGLDPIFQVLRTVPPLAWLPLSLAAFRNGQPSAIFVIFITAIWPIIINTAVGIRNIPQDYRNVAAVLRLNHLEFFFKIMVPAAAPYIFTGLRIGIGLSWLAIVAAEMLIGGVGIGFFIWDAWNSSRISEIILALVYVGLVGFILDRIVAAAATIVTRGTAAN
jgi:nitrate/nitrite transport system permease protein